MTNADRSTGDQSLLPRSTEEKIDAICDRFEAAWNAGERPAIEEYLGEWQEPVRSFLLRELLLVELEYRKRQGETARVEDYENRFENHGDTIRDVFAKTSASRPEDPTIVHSRGDEEFASRSTLTSAEDASFPGRSAQKPTGDELSETNRFGDYVLLEEIARGGMGVVYKARQLSLNRIVALKMILSGQLAGEEEVRRFRTEAQAAANLQHPHIVAIHKIGEHKGRHFFTMEFVDGKSLAELSKKKPQPPAAAARCVMVIARAIQYAHEQGVLHRDLKPSNILFDRRSMPRITDFGLAKLMKREDTGLTATGQILGTPSYMAPEQASGKSKEIGPESDVYSLGAILYTLLTGRPPFQGESSLDTLLKVVKESAIPPSQLAANIHRDLDSICLKCLEKSPENRYPSADALSRDLDRFLHGRPAEVRGLDVPMKERDFSSRPNWATQLMQECAEGRPSNHYSALGLDQHEDDHEKIAHAAAQRTALLRDLVTPKNVELVRTAIQRLAAAQKCLLDDDARAKYDSELAEAIAGDRPNGPPPGRAGTSIGESVPRNAQLPPAHAESTEKTNGSGESERRPARAAIRGWVRCSPRIFVQTRNISPYVWASLILGTFIVILLAFVFAPDERHHRAIHSNTGEGNTSSDNPINNKPLPPARPSDGVEGQGETKIKQELNDRKSKDVDESDGSSNEAAQVNSNSQVSLPLPAPVIAVDPFTELPSEVDLPPSDASKSDLTGDNGHRTQLGALGNIVASDLKVAIDSEVATLRNHCEFQAEPSGGEATVQSWEVYLVLGDTLGDEDSSYVFAPGGRISQPVAVISAGASSLDFKWGPSSGHPLAEQLRNCHLQLAHGPYEHRMRLRTVQKERPLSLDFNDRYITMPLDGPPLPDIEHLFLEVISLENFPGEWRVTPSGHRVDGGRDITISHVGEAKIELTMRLQEKDDQPAVRASARFFRDPRVSDSLTNGLLAERHAGAHNAIRDGQRRLAKATREASNTRARIVRLSSSTPRNASEAYDKMANLRRLKKQLQRCKQKIVKARNTIRNVNVTVASLKVISDIAEKMHQRAKVSLRVGVAVESGDYDLLVAQ